MHAMKIAKTDINYLIKNIFTWIFLNFSFNLIGLWFSKLLDRAGFNYLQSVTNEFVKPILIQSGVFIIVLIIAYAILKNRKITIYIFTLFQLLVFHIIFILNLNSTHMIHFETTLDDWGLKYLSNMGQYLVDILYIYLPLEGIFKNGSFIPLNTGIFYLEWIFLVLIYFGAISWLTKKTVQFFFPGKQAIENYNNLKAEEQTATEINSEKKIETISESELTENIIEENQEPKADIGAE